MNASDVRICMNKDGHGYRLLSKVIQPQHRLGRTPLTVFCYQHSICLQAIQLGHRGAEISVACRCMHIINKTQAQPPFSIEISKEMEAQGHSHPQNTSIKLYHIAVSAFSQPVDLVTKCLLLAQIGAIGAQHLAGHLSHIILHS